MSKTKWYILGGVFLSLAVYCLAVFLIKPVKAQTTSTTFPVDEAGIAAYVKLDNIENIDLGALAEALDSIEKQGESYVVGTVKVDNYVGANYPHVYIGMDGWLVAYYLNTEEASSIMQFKGWTPGVDEQPGPINTTTLKDAIDIICQKTGVSYPALSIKYYDFEFPEANKMTLIAEVAEGMNTNSFYVTVPGTLYEASYGIRVSAWGDSPAQLNLKVDGVSVLEENVASHTSRLFYGYYDSSTYFKTGITHYITFYCNFRYYFSGCATVLIYKN